MKIETWYVIPSDKCTTAEDLRKDPDAHGGLGMIMMEAIARGITTINLADVPDPDKRGAYSRIGLQTSNQAAVKRILDEGKVDVHSEGWFNTLTQKGVRVCFHQTETEVLTWTPAFLKH